MYRFKITFVGFLLRTVSVESNNAFIMCRSHKAARVSNCPILRGVRYLQAPLSCFSLLLACPILRGGHIIYTYCLVAIHYVSSPVSPNALRFTLRGSLINLASNTFCVDKTRRANRAHLGCVLRLCSAASDSQRLTADK